MRLLIHQERRKLIDGKERIVAKAKQYLVKELDKPVETQYGTVSKEDLKKPSGSTIKSSTGKPFRIIDADYIDLAKRIRKLPQTIPLKDIGLIIAESGIGKESTVVDGGVGSGALAAALARVCKKVISYDVREDHIKIAKENIRMLGLENIQIKNASLYDDIEERNVDLITLDVPEPWKVLPCADRALRVGGYIASYSPSIPQVQDFVQAVKKSNTFMHCKTVEIIERLWEIENRKVRPKSTGIGHSGFITFARKIGI
ncbi:methyltransferase domain-containing protein [Candidatus Woesearchaeota archaeon]|nr:MAG: methyltransferase domain-containing protein [Candidatus Woesearchaeota archaeon]